MDQTQIKLLEETLAFRNRVIPTVFIADSPWIPGYCGHTFMDYYADNSVWLSDNQKIIGDFPDAVFLPGWWVEYGMTAEPMGFGAPVCFFEDNMPHLKPLTEDIDRMAAMLSELSVPDPHRDGIMPFLLHQQKTFQPVLEAEGQQVHMVCARGPFTVASHLMTVTQLLMLVMLRPEDAHRLLRKTTDCVKRWLEAQLENVATAKAILVLDDVCGYFSPDDFTEFCLPYMKEIFDAFPQMSHYFHNDFTSDACYPYLKQMGVDVFNFTHTVDIADARRKIGSEVVLMGNVPPMLLTGDDPKAVYDTTLSVIGSYLKANGGPQGLMLSTGGGLPMGAKRENIDAVIAAVRDVNATLNR